jgi:hypothetical protein
LLGQSDVSEARAIDQALVESSPRSGVIRLGCRHPMSGVLLNRNGSEEDARPIGFRIESLGIT